MSARTGPEALVLGAGIQGVSAAMALAHHGWTVRLLDRATPLRGTSLRGEGKLHLGYVYGNDPTRATAELMVQGATTFSDLLDRWLPSPVHWPSVTSHPFHYAVLDGTLVDADTLAEHYAWVDQRTATALADGATYAGSTLVRPTQRLTAAERLAAGFSHHVADVFTTAEVAVNPGPVRVRLIEGARQRGVEFRGGTTVHGVERTGHGMRAHVSDADGNAKQLDADLVVNCLWDGRLAIDATMDIHPERAWSYRLKYGVHGLPAPGAPPVPSTTFVLGPFGDLVRQSDERVYASWYPDCIAGWSSDLVPPPEWRQSMEAPAITPEHLDIARRTLAAIGRLAPAAANVDVDRVSPGVVVAWGATDIDEPDSRLHRRDEIGVHLHDGYVSIDTGKLTTAPLFAQQLIDGLAR